MSIIYILISITLQLVQFVVSEEIEPQRKDLIILKFKSEWSKIFGMVIFFFNTKNYEGLKGLGKDNEELWCKS